MAKLSFNNSEAFRVKLTKIQEQQIRSLYRKIYKDIQKESANLPDSTSGQLRKWYLKMLQKQINDQLDSLGKSLEHMTKDHMEEMSESVVDDSIKFLNSVGLSIHGAFSHIPGEIVNTIISGKLYGGNWSLSKAIWHLTEKTKHDINSIIAEGIIKNKSSLDIAKDLERYVNPSARKPWDWSKVYPGVATKIDYNAQRLARTMVSHAYQQAFVKTTQPNPFVTAYRWMSSNSHRTCEICRDRATENHHGLGAGVFPKDDLPLDHPNGMCTFETVMPDSMSSIADRIADWVQGSYDPELDSYSEFLKNS